MRIIGGLRNLACVLMGGAAMSALVIPAYAQTGQAADAGTPAADAGTPAAGADEKGAQPSGAQSEGLGEIVVTATKRETNLQKTPIAISVLSAQNLADRHVQSLLDLADGAVPSLRVTTFEARQSALTIGIRGIVPLDANQPAREQGVGVYIDGVYLGRQHGLNVALLDLERIEVLKGPQGTLFGRNTEGGALSLVTKAPTGKFGVRVNGGLSNYGGYSGDVHVDFDKLGDFSVKVDGVLQKRGPTVKNPLEGASGFNQYERRGGRVAVRWEPASNFTADFALDVGYDASTPYYSQLVNHTGTATIPSSVQVTDKRMTEADIGVPQQPSVAKTAGATTNLKWEVAPGLELRSITAWRRVSATQWDNSGGAHRVPVYSSSGAFSRYSLANLKQHQFSQELQAVGSGAHLDYVGGLYYFNETSSDNAATPNSNIWNADGSGYTINSAALVNPFASIDRASIAHSKSYAAYGQATYTPTVLAETLHLTVGGRYTRDDKNGTLITFRNVANGSTFDKSWDRFNPMATLAYDASADVHLYAKYATAYRAGGASSRSPTYRTFDPEEVKSYEVGLKSQFLDNKVRFNLAGYIMDRKNSQIDFNAIYVSNGSNVNVLETVNAPGITKIRGVEADVSVNPVDRLTLTASYAYTYTKVPPTANPFKDNALQDVYIVFTPRNAASGAVDYAYPVGALTLKAHVDANYAQATQTFDQYATKNDASFIVNGRLSIADIPMSRGGMLTVSAWSRNLLNESHIYRRSPENEATLGDYANFNEPRTFGVEGSLKF